MSSALVVGGDGLIARTLASHLLGDGWNVTRTSRRNQLPQDCLHFDLQEGINALPDAVVNQTDVVFLCAAVTGFALCANEPESSRDINVTSTVRLAKRFLEIGARVVFLSSNAVFDGNHVEVDEHAPTSPVTEYGQQKADCEAALLQAATESSGSCAVVRLTKVVDRMQPLYSGWVQSFKARSPAKAAADLVMCPVTTAYVASGMLCIAAGSQSGVYHLSGERDMTYFDLALAMAGAFGPGATVEQDWVKERLGSVPAPVHSALSMAYTTGIFGLNPQPLQAVARELTGQDYQ